MNFGEALTSLKSGKRVYREGWNGKDMFLYYVPENKYPAQTTEAKSFFGDFVPYRDYIAIKTVEGYVVPWLASQTDVLSEDWQILE